LDVDLGTVFSSLTEDGYPMRLVDTEDAHPAVDGPGEISVRSGVAGRLVQEPVVEAGTGSGW
jgi:hypothetical protein